VFFVTRKFEFARTHRERLSIKIKSTLSQCFVLRVLRRCNHVRGEIALTAVCQRIEDWRIPLKGVEMSESVGRNVE
jgi:hypothetical protein